jgi:hypothetical protein
MMFAHMVASGLFSLLWLVVLGAAIWGATRLLADRQSTAAIAEPSALERLRRRYVQGEIDVATFAEMLDNLYATETPERARQMLRSARRPISRDPAPVRWQEEEDTNWTAEDTDGAEGTANAGDDEAR